MKKTMERNRFMKILQNLHFTDTQTAGKSDKTYKVHNDINHLKKDFKMQCLVSSTWNTNGVSSGGVDAEAKQNIYMSLIFNLAKRKK